MKLLSAKLVARATYEDDWFESDEPDTEPSEERGYTDPKNPWGGFTVECPDLVGDAFVAWRNENAEAVEFHETIEEVAEFCAAFPGGVWGYDDESEPSQQTTGRWRRVWLHLEGDEADIAEVFETLDLRGAS